MTHGVAVFHDGLEVLARETNFLGCALPRDGHIVCGKCELAGALGDHTVDVDPDLCVVNDGVVVVGNNDCVAHTDGVRYKRLRLGGRRGHHGVDSGNGGSRLCRGSHTFCCCGLCLWGHVFLAIVGSSGVVNGVVDGVINSVVVLVVLFAVGDFLF